MLFRFPDGLTACRLQPAMSDQFDPYYVWLGIQPKDQPPHHYRLLGIELFEENDQVIDVAANRQTSYLHEMASGPNAKHSQRLLNEIASARACLLDVDRKAKYDEKLRAKLTATEEPAAPAPASETPGPEGTSVPELPDFAAREAQADEVSVAGPIPLTCDACGSFYEVDAGDAGTLVECACGHVLTVPLPGGSPPSPAQTDDASGSSPDAVPGSEQIAESDASPVAVADPPVVAAEPQPEESGSASRSTGPRSKSEIKASLSKDKKDESEETPQKKKSGWGLSATIGIGTIVMAVVLFKVLLSDDSDEKTEKPSSPETQATDTEATKNDDDDDVPEDDGPAGTFGPIRLDVPGQN